MLGGLLKRRRLFSTSVCVLCIYNMYFFLHFQSRIFSSYINNFLKFLLKPTLSSNEKKKKKDCIIQWRSCV